MMKGKSIAERKRLLKEIEDQRQKQLQIQFTLERQRLLNDERWARRNVQDRQLMLEQIENRHRSDSQRLRKTIEEKFNLRIDQELEIDQNLHMHTLSDD